MEWALCSEFASLSEELRVKVLELELNVVKLDRSEVM